MSLNAKPTEENPVPMFHIGLNQWVLVIKRVSDCMTVCRLGTGGIWHAQSALLKMKEPGAELTTNGHQ